MQRLILVTLLAASTSAFANDVDPFGFEKQATASGLTRFGELGPVAATEAQEQAIRHAGLRALEQSGSIE